MVFFPDNILKNILSFCDDRIERHQLILKKGIISSINILNQLRNLHRLNINICDISSGFFELDYNGYFKVDSLVFDNIDPVISGISIYIKNITSLLIKNNQTYLYTEYLSPFDSLLGDCI